MFLLIRDGPLLFYPGGGYHFWDLQTIFFLHFVMKTIFYDHFKNVTGFFIDLI